MIVNFSLCGIALSNHRLSATKDQKFRGAWDGVRAPLLGGQSFFGISFCSLFFVFVVFLCVLEKISVRAALGALRTTPCEFKLKYVHIYICVCVYVYIYIYILTEQHDII